jgi:Mitochondrial carrier protein
MSISLLPQTRALSLAFGHTHTHTTHTKHNEWAWETFLSSLSLFLIFLAMCVLCVCVCVCVCLYIVNGVLCVCVSRLSSYSGSIDCATKILREEGVAGLFGGFQTHLVSLLPELALSAGFFVVGVALIKLAPESTLKTTYAQVAQLPMHPTSTGGDQSRSSFKF